jgi:hypothetical protein
MKNADDLRLEFRNGRFCGENGIGRDIYLTPGDDEIFLEGRFTANELRHLANVLEGHKGS